MRPARTPTAASSTERPAAAQPRARRQPREQHQTRGGQRHGLRGARWPRRGVDPEEDVAEVVERRVRAVFAGEPDIDALEPDGADREVGKRSGDRIRSRRNPPARRKGRDPRRPAPGRRGPDGRSGPSPVPRDMPRPPPRRIRAHTSKIPLLPSIPRFSVALRCKSGV